MLSRLSKLRACLIVLGAALLQPMAAYATPYITLGTYDLTPAMAGQQIAIYVSGSPTGGGSGGVAEGCNFDITIGDGTANAAAPKITAVNLVASGSMFASNGYTAGDTNTNASFNQFWEINIASNTLSANISGTSTDPITGIHNQALLAVVTIDTTGATNPSSWSISVGGTVNNGSSVVTAATDFPNAFFANQGSRNTNYVDGSIVIPEPASLGLLALGIPALLLRRRCA